MNTDDKASVLILTVTIIAVTEVATLSWTDLIPDSKNLVQMYVDWRQVDIYILNSTLHPPPPTPHPPANEKGQVSPLMVSADDF